VLNYLVFFTNCVGVFFSTLWTCAALTRWTTLAANQTPNTIQDRRYSIQGLDNTTA